MRLASSWTIPLNLPLIPNEETTFHKQYALSQKEKHVAFNKTGNLSLFAIKRMNFPPSIRKMCQCEKYTTESLSQCDIGN